MERAVAGGWGEVRRARRQRSERGRRQRGERRRRAALACAVALASGIYGCGDEAEPTVDEQTLTPPSELAEALDHTAPPLELDAPTVFHRIELVREADGVVSVGDIAAVELERLPLPALDAEYLLVGYADGAVLSAQPVAFPTRALGLRRDEDGIWVHDSIPLTSSTVTVFVPSDPALDELVLITPDDERLVELSGEALAAASVEKRSLPRGLGSLRQAITLQELESRYPHIDFLGPEDTGKLHPEVLAGGDIIEPTEAMNDVIADGLGRVAPALLSSVQTIAWVSWPLVEGRPDWDGFASGSHLALNADRAEVPDMALTLVHEVAHNFADLVGAAGGRGRLDEWRTPEPADAARRLLDRFRLARGLLGTWKRLHESGVPEGVTEAFEASPSAASWKRRTKAEAVAVGFGSAYAASEPEEDFAEYVGSVQAPVPGEPNICSTFAGVSELSPRVAIPYAKLVLLRGLGAVTQAAFDACTSRVSLSSTPGIHFSGVISFQSALQAGWLDAGAAFGILGNGPNTYRLLVQVKLAETRGSPLGLHRLDYIGFGNVGDAGLSGAYLAHDNELRARSGEQGLVLFTEASAERTTGALFGLVLQNAVGANTDYFPFGTFRIP